MRIDEVDDRSLEQKLRAMINHPSTNPNVKATAEKKLADLLSRRASSKPSSAQSSTRPTTRFEPVTPSPATSTNFKVNQAYKSAGEVKPNPMFSKKA